MGFAEFVLHLSRMNPDMMYLHQDCGYLNISYFKFDIDDQTGEYSKTCLKQPLSKRPKIGFQDQISLKETRSATINISKKNLFSF